MRKIEHSGISASLSNLLCRRYSHQQKTPVLNTGVLLWIAAAMEILSVRAERQITRPTRRLSPALIGLALEGA